MSLTTNLSKTPIICPTCNKETSGSTICDNDCGTEICNNCTDSYYSDKKGNYIKGHNPLCGCSSDEETTNSGIRIIENK